MQSRQKETVKQQVINCYSILPPVNVFSTVGRGYLPTQNVILVESVSTEGA